MLLVVIHPYFSSATGISSNNKAGSQTIFSLAEEKKRTFGLQGQLHDHDINTQHWRHCTLSATILCISEDMEKRVL